MLTAARPRCSLFLLIPIFLILLSLLGLHRGTRQRVLDHITTPDTPPPTPVDEEPPPDVTPTPKYKPAPEKHPPIADHFQLATATASLPQIPPWNLPPKPHVKHYTPLFIGFTRNWLVLEQTIVSYITSGWPAEDIYVIDNTGTMTSNKYDRLTLQNPFYLNYQRLTKVLGINVIETPTLLTFAQLQNFFTWLAIEHNWEYYFWGHMDVLALCEEEWRDPDTGKYKSLYLRVVDVLERNLSPEWGRWGLQFFAYDRLALVNRTAYEEVGGWDTMIPFYMTDCDMHERLTMAELRQDDTRVGLIYDVGDSLPDLAALYRPKPKDSSQPKPATPSRAPRSASPAEEPEDEPPPPLERLRKTKYDFSQPDELNSPTYRLLMDACDQLQREKNSGERNTWQGWQQGGQGEPFYRDAEGFETALQMTMELGRNVFAEKWGHRDCAIRGAGLTAGDPWRVEHDWRD